MEDRTFELIEKLYSEFTEFKKETKEGMNDLNNKFEGLDNKFEGLDNKVQGLDNKVQGLNNEVQGLNNEVQGLKKIVLRIEHDHGHKLDALFDGYRLIYEKLDNHEGRIQVLERGR